MKTVYCSKFDCIPQEMELFTINIAGGQFVMLPSFATLFYLKFLVEVEGTFK